VLYEGALANMAASFLGGYPFWLTFNYLTRAFPVPKGGPLALKLAHRAVIGFCSTAVSGTPCPSRRTSPDLDACACAVATAAHLYASRPL
jgi:hypothetical protein